MSRLSLTIFTTLLLAVSALGQTAPSDCPKLEVIGPQGITVPGDNMTFRAVVSPVDPKLEYSWTISKSERSSLGGVIVSGQGTPAIVASTDRTLDVQSITATVEVDGLPQGCERVAHETAGIASSRVGHVYPLDEFGDLPRNDQRGRLDLFLHELRQNPNNRGFVDIYRSDRKKADAIMRLYVSHLRFRKFDLSRISFRLGVKPESTTVFWRVPIGGEPWACEGCTTISGEGLK